MESQNKPLRLVMMGTGHFALPAFRSLYDSPHEVVGIFTQPDRLGKGHHQHRHPLKELAEENKTPVFQPQNVNSPESLSRLRALDADLCVVAAYGQILSAELLEIPKLGAINLHASLLPKYRGAAPVLYAILNGETETGITIFQIEPKLDAGPILDVEKTMILPKETTGELTERLSHQAVPVLQRVLEGFRKGTLRKTIQKTDRVTKAPSLKKSAGIIDWSKTAKEIACHIRAMQPWPNPFTFLNLSDGRQLRAIISDVEVCAEEILEDSTGREPGTITKCDGKNLLVQTGEGQLQILELKPEGKPSMPIASFLNGYALEAGDRFGK